jgi:hypothetical protein
MRLIACLISLLYGCAAPAIRCDTHLVPINSPVAADRIAVTVTPAVPRSHP